MDGEFDVDSHLKRLENEFLQQQEIDELLAIPSIDAFSILGFGQVFLQPPDTKGIHVNLRFPTPNDVKKVYRKKSLMVHPDRNPLPKARDAFELLTKASTVLGEYTEDKDCPSKRQELFEWLDEAIQDTRGPLNDQDRLPRVQHRFVQLATGQGIGERAQVYQRNLEMAATREKDQLHNYKQKAAKEKEWEAKREDRIAGWRQFATKKPKLVSKKKTRDPWEAPPPVNLPASKPASKPTNNPTSKPTYKPY
jgi:DnaJ family protein C protein 8